MRLPIKLISTDFDGTLHADYEDPPVPLDLQTMIGELQEQGAKWVINTGRNMEDVLIGMERARMSIRPDYLVVVEREIYRDEDGEFVTSEDWNEECRVAHDELFDHIAGDLPGLVDWVQDGYQATLYRDQYSPFCLIAENNEDADAIQSYVETYYTEVPNLSFVRNDVYGRFSHKAYNKGSALAEIGRQLGIGREEILAAGDHLNDLPMLSLEYARYLVAPFNAVPEVKKLVMGQGGFVSEQPWGHGVARGLEYFLERSGRETG